METIAGLFRTFKDADQAVDALEKAGFNQDAISLLARNQVIEENVPRDRTAKEVAGSAGAGAVGGGVVGGVLGLLIGLGAIVIPGLGPAFAAGALASALGTAAGGAGVGAAVGGILGAMTALRIPEEEAQIYAEGVRRGGILVTVQAEDAQADIARTVMRNSNAVDIEELRKEWQQSGWKQFEETGEPDPDETVNWNRVQDK